MHQIFFNHAALAGYTITLEMLKYTNRLAAGTAVIQHFEIYGIWLNFKKCNKQFSHCYFACNL